MAKKPLKKRVVKKKQDKVGLRITILLIWFLAGLYVGIAGWEKIYNNELKRQAAEAELMFDCSDLTRGFIYEGRSYCTIEDVNVEEHINFIANLRLGWMFYLPNPLPLLLTAFAFGAVGSVVKIIRTMIRLQEFSSFYALSLSPALG